MGLGTRLTSVWHSSSTSSTSRRSMSTSCFINWHKLGCVLTKSPWTNSLTYVPANGVWCCVELVRHNLLSRPDHFVGTMGTEIETHFTLVVVTLFYFVSLFPGSGMSLCICKYIINHCKHQYGCTVGQMVFGVVWNWWGWGGYDGAREPWYIMRVGWLQY